jgi:hypothetical protein
MPRSSNPAAVIVNALLIPLGVVVMAAGVVGALTADGMRWAFGLLAVGGAVIVGGAIHGAVAWRRAVQVDDETAHAMVAAARAGPASATIPTGPVLAHWTYGPDDWAHYAAGEIRYRTREALGMGAAVLVLGTPVIGLMEGDWGIGALISGTVGGFIALMRGLMAFSAHRRNRAVTHGEVIVGPTALLVNGRYEAIHDANVRFGGARVLEDGSPAILEVTIMVPGRYRRTAEEYRIPIPAGREDEARAVALGLAEAHPGSGRIAAQAGSSGREKKSLAP